MSKKLSELTKLEKLLINTGDFALKRRARIIVEDLDPKKGDKILDVGCGDGYYLHLLSNLGIKDLKLTGIDLDKNALKSARKNLNNKNIRLIRADIMKTLPFNANSFNKIIMSEVLEHLEDDVKGLREVKRVLAPNGTLCISVPNHDYPFLWDPINWLLERLFGTHIKSGFWAGIWNQHERLYKPEDIENVIRKADFKIKEIESLTYWSLPFNHYIVNLGARILAGKTRPKVLAQGASKFSKRSKKSLPVNLLFFMSNLVDKINDFWTSTESGVTIFVRAMKK